VNKKNLDNVLDEQVVDVPVETPKEKNETVYYTDVSYIIGKEFIEMMLRSNPGDKFDEIPRR
jgi:hypothetical protein